MQSIFKYFLFFLLAFCREGWANDRIISLKPNITEIVYDLGFGNNLVGVTTYCDSPSEAALLPKVADYIHINTEKLILQKPSLVLASKENSLEKEISFVRSQGINVEVFPFNRLNDVSASILQLGRQLNAESKAKEIINLMNAEILKAKNQLSTIVIPKNVLIIVGTSPLVVVGGGNIIDDILSALGIGNIYRNSDSHYPVTNIEDVLIKKPDLIFDLSMGDEEKTKKEHWAWLSQYESIPAVQKRAYAVLNIRDFRPAPSLVNGVNKLVDILKNVSSKK